MRTAARSNDKGNSTLYAVQLENTCKGKADLKFESGSETSRFTLGPGEKLTRQLSSGAKVWLGSQRVHGVTSQSEGRTITVCGK